MEETTNSKNVNTDPESLSIETPMPVKPQERAQRTTLKCKKWMVIGTVATLLLLGTTSAVAAILLPGAYLSSADEPSTSQRTLTVDVVVNVGSSPVVVTSAYQLEGTSNWHIYAPHEHTPGRCAHVIHLGDATVASASHRYEFDGTCSFTPNDVTDCTSMSLPAQTAASSNISLPSLTSSLNGGVFRNATDFVLSTQPALAAPPAAQCYALMTDDAAKASATVQGAGSPEGDLISVAAQMAHLMPAVKKALVPQARAARASCPRFVDDYSPFAYTSLSYPQSPSLTAQNAKDDFPMPDHSSCSRAKAAADAFHSSLKAVTDVQDKVDNYGQFIAGVGANAEQLHADLTAIEKVLCHSIPTAEKLKKIKKFKSFASAFVSALKSTKIVAKSLKDKVKKFNDRAESFMKKTGLVNEKNAELAEKLAQAKFEVRVAEKTLYQSPLCTSQGDDGALLSSGLTALTSVLDGIERLPIDRIDLKEPLNALNGIKAQIDGLKVVLKPVHDAVTFLETKIVNPMTTFLAKDVCLNSKPVCSGHWWNPWSWRCQFVCTWRVTYDQMLDAAGTMQTFMDLLPVNPMTQLADWISGEIMKAVGKPIETQIYDLIRQLGLDETLGLDDFSDSVQGIETADTMLRTSVNLDLGSLTMCECTGGAGYGRSCGKHGYHTEWCYLSTRTHLTCSGASQSSNGRDYWSIEPCK